MLRQVAWSYAGTWNTTGSLLAEGRRTNQETAASTRLVIGEFLRIRDMNVALVHADEPS